MKTTSLRLWICAVVVSFLLCAGRLYAQPPGSGDMTFSLTSTDGLDVVNGKSEASEYRGRKAVKLVAGPDHETADTVVAILSGTNFKDGIIEADVAGFPRTDAPKDDRGFIGVAFRVQDHGARLENIYIRATNGRAEEQIRRNHAVQYESIPDFPWYRLRKENPGVYESYTDLEAGAWTHLKIVVSGTKARLYVNGAEQPCLIVNDLKLGDVRGAVGLWAFWSTEAYFSNVRIHNE